jgi:starch-binding outer membrane protein, SusD/RagB family
MRKIFSFIILFSLLVLGSCKKLVDEVPLSDGTLDQFFKNRYDADAAIAAMYGQFQQQMVGEAQFKNRHTYWGETRSDNLESTPGTGNTAAVREMHYNALTANNDYADWTGLYRLISMANLNILKFPDINVIAAGSPKDQLDNATFNSYMAQCYAMRAVAYFYIVRLWGDAPLRTKPYLDANESPEQARDPQSKILDQIVADLTTAYTLIPKAVNAPVWYIGEAAICAILADVYMWKHDYDNAIIWFKNLFKAKSPTGKVYNAAGTGATGSGGAATDLEPTASWKNVFTNPTGSLEAIWNIHWDVNANGCPCMTAVSSSVNNGPVRVSVEIFKGTNTQGVVQPNYQWVKSTTDIRPKQTFNVNQSTMAQIWKYYPGSYTGTTYNAVTGTDKNVYITMYRLADQYLLYAEALNKKGDLTNALKYMNLIHVRAGNAAYPSTQFTTEADMENAILQERQWELFAEGKRWFDLIRTDHVYQVMDPVLISRQIFQGAEQVGFGLDKNDKRKYLWPLHRNVLNSNSLLVQNPPYTE